MHLLRELDQGDLGDEKSGRVARLDRRADDEAPHHVAVAAHNLHRHVLSRLRALHPASQHHIGIEFHRVVNVRATCIFHDIEFPRMVQR